MASGRSKNLTPQETIFVKEYINTRGNKTEAAARAYNTTSRDSAKHTAQGVWKRPIVQTAVKALLEKNGMTLDNIGTQLHKSMRFNLDEGKASQAVGADLLKFAFLLHDAIPAHKSVNANLNIKGETPPPDTYIGLKQLLEDNLESTKLLLNEINKETK